MLGAASSPSAARHEFTAESLSAAVAVERPVANRFESDPCRLRSTLPLLRGMDSLSFRARPRGIDDAREQSSSSVSVRYHHRDLHRQTRCSMRRSRTFAVLTFAGLATSSAAQNRTIAPGENLVVDGVPAISASLADEVRRYRIPASRLRRLAPDAPRDVDLDTLRQHRPDPSCQAARRRADAAHILQRAGRGRELRAERRALLRVREGRRRQRVRAAVSAMTSPMGR